MAEVRYNEKGYVCTANDEHEKELKFTKNGKVDLKVVPKGYRFTPYPLPSWKSVSKMHLDPRYVRDQTYSATNSVAFFLLEPEATSRKNHQSYKTEFKREERYAARHVTFTDLEKTDEETGDTIPYDPPAPHNTEEEAIANVVRDEIIKKLRIMDAENRAYNEQFCKSEKAVKRITNHATIYIKCYIYKDSVTEASGDLKMPKATVSKAIGRINKVVRPYYEID